MWLGMLSYLKAGKAAPESWFSGLYHASSVWIIRRQFPGPQFPSQVGCLHSVSLANTFLGQHGPTHGGHSGSASEGARVPCWGHLAEPPGTSHLSPVRGGGPAPGAPNAGAGSKASSGRRKQTAMGGLGKRLMGCTVLGFPG